MIGITHVRAMARYNRWQNASLIAAARMLSDEERRADRGAFFGSIEATFSHLFWGDQTWMHRFAGTPKAQGGIAASAGLITDWDDFVPAREQFDTVIVDWAAALDPHWLEGDLTWWSGAANREVTKPVWLLVTHFFNHQTHHRGQIHAMLTAAGTRPDDTDLFMMPDAV